MLAAGLVEDRPDLGRYPEAVAGWATAEAQAALIRRRLDEVGSLDDHGEPRAGLLNWLTKLESAAGRHRAVLGLDPTAEARLSRDRAAAAALATAVDLDALAARGRAALDARAAEGTPPDLAAMALARVHEQARPKNLPALSEAVTELIREEQTHDSD